MTKSASSQEFAGVLTASAQMRTKCCAGTWKVVDNTRVPSIWNVSNSTVPVMLLVLYRKRTVALVFVSWEAKKTVAAAPLESVFALSPSVRYFSGIITSF